MLHLSQSCDVIGICVDDVNEDGVGGIETTRWAVVPEVETLVTKIWTSGVET